MNLDTQQIAHSMSEAVRLQVGEKWEELEPEVEDESRELAQTLVELQKEEGDEQLSKAAADVLIRTWALTVKAVLLRKIALEKQKREEAINAAIDAARFMVLKVVGSALS